MCLPKIHQLRLRSHNPDNQDNIPIRKPARRRKISNEVEETAHQTKRSPFILRRKRKKLSENNDPSSPQLSRKSLVHRFWKSTDICDKTPVSLTQNNLSSGEECELVRELDSIPYQPCVIQIEHNTPELSPCISSADVARIKKSNLDSGVSSMSLSTSDYSFCSVPICPNTHPLQRKREKILRFDVWTSDEDLNKCKRDLHTSRRFILHETNEVYSTSHKQRNRTENNNVQSAKYKIEQTATVHTSGVTEDSTQESIIKFRVEVSSQRHESSQLNHIEEHLSDHRHEKSPIVQSNHPEARDIEESHGYSQDNVSEVINDHEEDPCHDLQSRKGDQESMDPLIDVDNLICPQHVPHNMQFAKEKTSKHSEDDLFSKIEETLKYADKTYVQDHCITNSEISSIKIADESTDGIEDSNGYKNSSKYFTSNQLRSKSLVETLQSPGEYIGSRTRKITNLMTMHDICVSAKPIYSVNEKFTLHCNFNILDHVDDRYDDLFLLNPACFNEGGFSINHSATATIDKLESKKTVILGTSPVHPFELAVPNDNEEQKSLSILNSTKPTSDTCQHSDISEKLDILPCHEQNESPVPSIDKGQTLDRYPRKINHIQINSQINTRLSDQLVHENIIYRSDHSWTEHHQNYFTTPAVGTQIQQTDGFTPTVVDQQSIYVANTVDAQKKLYSSQIKPEAESDNLISVITAPSYGESNLRQSTVSSPTVMTKLIVDSNDENRLNASHVIATNKTDHYSPSTPSTQIKCSDDQTSNSPISLIMHISPTESLDKRYCQPHTFASYNCQCDDHGESVNNLDQYNKNAIKKTVNAIDGSAFICHSGQTFVSSTKSPEPYVLNDILEHLLETADSNQNMSDYRKDNAALDMNGTTNEIIGDISSEWGVVVSRKNIWIDSSTGEQHSNQSFASNSKSWQRRRCAKLKRIIHYRKWMDRPTNLLAKHCVDTDFRSIPYGNQYARNYSHETEQFLESQSTDTLTQPVQSTTYRDNVSNSSSQTESNETWNFGDVKPLAPKQISNSFEELPDHHDTDRTHRSLAKRDFHLRITLNERNQLPAYIPRITTFSARTSLLSFEPRGANQVRRVMNIPPGFHFVTAHLCRHANWPHTFSSGLEQHAVEFNKAHAEHTSQSLQVSKFNNTYAVSAFFMGLVAVSPNLRQIPQWALELYRTGDFSLFAPFYSIDRPILRHTNQLIQSIGSRTPNILVSSLFERFR